MSRTRLGILIVVVIGAAIAAVTVGGAVRNVSQERGRLLSLASELEDERAELDSLEQTLTEQEAQLARAERTLIDLRNWITTVELRYPRGIPSNVYGEYTESVDRYNTGIDEYNAAAATYHTAQEEYVARVDSFNARVLQIPEFPDGERLKDLEGWSIPLLLSGTLENPKLGVDLAEFAKTRAAEELRDKLFDKLGLQKKPEPAPVPESAPDTGAAGEAAEAPADDSQAAPEQPEPEPQQQEPQRPEDILKRGLEDLFGR